MIDFILLVLLNIWHFRVHVTVKYVTLQFSVKSSWHQLGVYRWVACVCPVKPGSVMLLISQTILKVKYCVRV